LNILLSVPEVVVDILSQLILLVVAVVLVD
jgi:hypothetical protein